MKRILLLFIILITLIGCKEDNEPQNPIDQLPPETQTGANTFGCLINGKPFIVSNTSHQVAIYQRGALLIGGQKDNNNFIEQISMFIGKSVIGAPIEANNSYILNTNTVPKGEYYTEVQNCFYFTSSTYNGFLRITYLNTENYIISGTFEFQVKSDSCEEVFNITNGRFDLQYTP